MVQRATAISVIIASLSLMPAFAAATDATPTYNEDVGRILLDNCAGCHRPNQIAPMSLLTYAETRPWARAIKSQVVKRNMPPWFADPQYGHFKNDSSLSKSEIATIVAWVDSGAAEGSGDAPDGATRFSEAGWSHPSGRDPDYIIDFPIEWQIPAEAETPNFNIYTPLPFDQSIRVEATEVRPGNYAATHHIVTLLMNVPSGMKIGTGPAWPGGPVVDYVLIPDPDAEPGKLAEAASAFGELLEAANDPDGDVAQSRSGFGAYIPGVGAAVTPRGQARTVRADLFDTIVWNIHYQATGRPETARPQIGIWFAKDDATTVARTLSLREYTSENRQLIAPPPLSKAERMAAFATRQAGQGLNPLLDPIAPNDGDWTVTGIGAFQNDSILESLFIHAHLRGKDFTYVLTYPDGREQILLRVENYRFDWQFSYDLLEPMRVPAGSTLKVISRYDNSRANEFNPAPQKTVYWSEQSWDDMFLATAGYTLVSDRKQSLN